MLVKQYEGETLHHLYELHGHTGLLLPPSGFQSFIGNLRGCLEVDYEVQWDSNVGIEPVIPGDQNFQLGATEGSFLFGVLQKAVSVILNASLDYLDRTVGRFLQKLQSCQLDVALELK